MIKVNELLVKQVCLKTLNQILKILTTPDFNSPDNNLNSPSDSEWVSWADEIIEVKLSNMKYAAKFPCHN